MKSTSLDRSNWLVIKLLPFSGIKFYLYPRLTPKVLRGQILGFAILGHVVVIRRCDMIFWEFYGK
jgi:hypothetical protein